MSTPPRSAYVGRGGENIAKPPGRRGASLSGWEPLPSVRLPLHSGQSARVYGGERWVIDKPFFNRGRRRRRSNSTREYQRHRPVNQAPGCTHEAARGSLCCCTSSLFVYVTLPVQCTAASTAEVYFKVSAAVSVTLLPLPFSHQLLFSRGPPCSSRRTRPIKVPTVSIPTTRNGRSGECCCADSSQPFCSSRPPAVSSSAGYIPVWVAAR
jgi:hypothetical protein